jgi:hypothetical protein
MLIMESRKPVFCSFWKTSPGSFLEICDRICSSWVLVSGGVVHVQERNTKTASTTSFSRITITLFIYRSKAGRSGGGLSGADSGLAFPVIEVMGTGTRRFSSVRGRRGVLWSCSRLLTCGESRCRGCEVNLRNRFGSVGGSRESAPCFCGGAGGDGREAREQRSAQGWQQGAGGVRFVESSEASPVIPVGNSAYHASRHFCVVESRGA